MKHAVRRHQAGGDHLLSLIEGTLDIARIESGKLSLDVKPVRLDELLQQITGLIEHEARAKRLRFVADIERHLPEAVRADEQPCAPDPAQRAGQRRQVHRRRGR